MIQALARAQQQADEVRTQEAATRAAYQDGTLSDLLLRRAEAARQQRKEWERERTV